MEFLRLSKFKLQLRTLISELRELRERERSAKEQLHHRIQKQKQSEEEYGGKIQELQEELSSSHEQRQKLEKKLSYLQNDNVLLENKQKGLKETIQELVLSKEHFVNSYEESTYDMKRSIEIRDRKISALSEKMKSHLLLFDSIEKEAFSVKHVVDNVQQVLSEKEEIDFFSIYTAATLKSKLDAVSAFEKTFVEKIYDLEKKLRYNEDEMRRKNNVISELEVKLEAAKIRTASQTHIDELQKSLWEKDAVIKNLTLKNETLYFELESLGTIFKKIRDILANMTVEDKRRFSPILECQGVEMVSTKEDNRIEDVNQSSRKYSSVAFGTGATLSTASPLSLKSVAIHSRGNNNVELCVSESASSKTQSAANDPSISVNDENV